MNSLGLHVAPLLLGAVGDTRVLSRYARKREPEMEYAAGGLLAGTGVEAATEVAGVVAMNRSRAQGQSLEEQHTQREQNR